MRKTLSSLSISSSMAMLRASLTVTGFWAGPEVDREAALGVAPLQGARQRLRSSPERATLTGADAIFKSSEKSHDTFIMRGCVNTVQLMPADVMWETHAFFFRARENSNRSKLMACLVDGHHFIGQQAGFPGFARERGNHHDWVSGLHFPTPSWAWSLLWRWYQKAPIMFYHRAGMLPGIPTASNPWMPVPLNCLFQHLLGHDACPKGGGQNNQ